MALIETNDLVKKYNIGGMEVDALCGVTINMEEGEFVSIMGPSGSGKSTFMNILGCLDTPTSGGYKLSGVDIGALNRDELAAIRSKKIGFVFQTFNLLARTSAIENVELPMFYAGVPAKIRKERATHALKTVGLEQRAKHYPSQLSGGQQQRVAIARAIVNDASIIFADEPTGSIDSATSAGIMELFSRLNNERCITIVLVTHEHDIAAYGRRLIKFRDGRIISDSAVKRDG